MSFLRNSALEIIFQGSEYLAVQGKHEDGQVFYHFQCFTVTDH